MGQAQSKKSKSKSRKVPNFESKEEYFINNGGILLKNQIALSQGRDLRGGQLKIFSNKDIGEATNNYDPDLMLTTQGGATIYKGILENRVVSVIMAPSILEPESPDRINMLLMGASILMVMNHKHLPTIYGCCLETYIPMIVCEFFPNGTLFQHLHGGIPTIKRMKWMDCLRVVTETGYAVSYVHSALPKPVVHRLLNSTSIYLDGSFHAKLGKFGYAVLITPGDRCHRWPIKGNMGYIDPEYVETREVTEKCDVYSFGVLMLELLTRRKPSMMAISGMDLVQVFISAVQKNCMIEIIDSGVLEQASWNEIQRVAQLALACVAKKGDERPTMIDVVCELWSIQSGRQEV